MSLRGDLELTGSKVARRVPWLHTPWARGCRAGGVPHRLSSRTPLLPHAWGGRSWAVRLCSLSLAVDSWSRLLSTTSTSAHLMLASGGSVGHQLAIRPTQNGEAGFTPAREHLGLSEEPLPRPRSKPPTRAGGDDRSSLPASVLPSSQHFFSFSA